MSRVDVVLREVNSASREGHFKDFVLDRLAEVANVAQFASFGPSDSMSRFSRILGLPSNEALDVEIAVTHLLERSRDHSVNVRSFRPLSGA